MRRDLRLSLALVAALGGTACDRTPTSSQATGAIVLQVAYEEEGAAKPAETQAVDGMVATVRRGGTLVLRQDLARVGNRWQGQIEVEAGYYQVELEARKNGMVRWRGQADAQVRGGKSTHVDVSMRLVDTVELPGGATVEFVWIAPGAFVMGDSDYVPQHQVTISRGFWLGKYEITQAQWEAVMGSRPWGGQSYVRANPSHPAVYISWYDVQELVGRLNTTAGEAVYRLPTEAEWEYACRAGTTTRWSFGDDERQLGEYAWYDDNAWNAGLQYAQPVGGKRPNPWGLYDMHGNVLEWVQDWYGSYSSGSQVDPQGLSNGSYRVVRGGAFSHYAGFARSACRIDYSPGYRGNGLGARLLRTR